MYPLFITSEINMKQYHFLALLLTPLYSCRLSPQFLRYSEKKNTSKSEKNSLTIMWMVMKKITLQYQNFKGMGGLGVVVFDLPLPPQSYYWIKTNNQSTGTFKRLTCVFEHLKFTSILLKYFLFLTGLIALHSFWVDISIV